MSRHSLPEGAIRLIRECSLDEPRKLRDDERRVAEVLADRGYLELLPGCEATYGVTAKGEAVLRGS